MYVLNSMKITAKTSDVLATLMKNRETHTKIVVEARAGYMKKAREAVKAKLDRLESGKLVSLVFYLQVPVDYTKVYDTAIQMLQMHQQDLIELDSSQVRSLIQDQWEWTQSFYGTNKAYSSTANDMDPGGDDNDDAVGASAT